MISLYGLTYYALEYAQEAIESIIATADEPLEINVIDAHSDRSNEIVPWGMEMVRQNKITRLISASTNCKGAGTVWAFNNFPPKDGNFIVITDLDILAKPGWMKEIRQNIDKNPVVGFTLDMSNYAPPNFGFTESGFGSWLKAVRLSTYRKYIKSHDHHVDSHLLHQVKQRFYKSSLELYHLGWNIYKDYPEYWKQKVEGIAWHESEPSTYTVIEGV